MTKSKREFLIENKFTKNIKCTPEEYTKFKTENPDKFIEDHLDDTHYDTALQKYITDNHNFSAVDDSLSHDEIVEEALFAINKKAKITMYCAIFFVVITLISMITTFVFTYKISKVTDVFDEIYSYDSSDDYDYDYWD